MDAIKLSKKEQQVILNLRKQEEERAKQLEEEKLRKQFRKEGFLKEDAYEDQDDDYYLISAAERDEKIIQFSKTFVPVKAGTKFVSDLNSGEWNRVSSKKYYGFHDMDDTWAQKNLRDITQVKIEPKPKKTRKKK